MVPHPGRSSFRGTSESAYLFPDGTLLLNCDVNFGPPQTFMRSLRHLVAVSSF